MSLNYGKRGIETKRKTMRSLSVKLERKIIILLSKLLLLAAVAGVVIGTSAGIGMFKGVLSSAPDISHIDVSPRGFSTFVYDNEGHQIAKLVAADSNRIPVSMDKIPKNLANAFVAIEDERFYDHTGIDIKGIFRAAAIAVKNRDLSQGASTITQQLIKNNVFDGWTNETTVEKIKRKIQEQYLAMELEKVMDKEKILENYMNTINLGQSTLGVQAASLRYFGKNVYELTLSECAVIAAITQNPSKYNPISHPEENVKRQKTVLSHMLEQGFISREEYEEAVADDVYSRIHLVNEETPNTDINTYFVDALTEDVLRDLVNIGGYSENQAYNLLYSGGLAIYSTQDARIQDICDEVFGNEDNYPSGTKWLLSYDLSVKKADGSIENHSSEMYRKHYREKRSGFDLLYSSREAAEEEIEEYKNAVMEGGDEVLAERISLTPQPQVSITIEDQNTGYIMAMVGGRGAKEASRTLNRATSTNRQPGSTFKVVSTYAPALDSAGLSLASVFTDAPYNYANGRPVSNWYSSGYRGICTIREGIYDSLNIIAVKALTQITPQLGYDYLLNFGFTTLKDRYEVNGEVFSDIQQSLALGGITLGVTNEELNAAYAAIANGGTYYKPTLYTKVVDYDGNVLLDNTVPDNHFVIKETTAYLLTDAMQDVVRVGTGGSVAFPGQAIAGKTGTTSDYNDVWFAGYTPYYTATTWAGYDNNAKLAGEGKNLAKTLWKKTMQRIHENLPERSFTRPAGIVNAEVCSKSGRLPIPGVCTTVNSELFDQDALPTESCNVHFSGMVCAYTMMPASDECPFKAPGTLEMDPDSQSAVAAPEGEGQAPVVLGARCPHDALFMMRPEAEALISQQRAEMLIANGIDPNTGLALGGLPGAVPEIPTLPEIPQPQDDGAVDVTAQ